MSQNHYDVVIIGGRCAGASLALWLAGNDLKILLLDRATFPSPPNVPSAPHIHPGTMRLLDELGIPEADYAHAGSRIDYFAMEMVGYFQAVMPTAQMQLDRNYFYGIDRNHFDNILWGRAASVTGVTAREGFSVTKIQKHENKVIGQGQDGDSETFTADLIVGADGRYSFTARQLDAAITEERNKHTSAVYYAEWDNVDDHSPEYSNAISTYNTPDGMMMLAIPIAERKYIIGSAVKSDAAHFGVQGFEQAYHESLKHIPNLWKRLTNAQRVTDVAGMRPIGNGYREAYGDNWALVGDAVHYKDPSDGQGIYDALLESKLLAQSIIDWKLNGTSWQVAGANYQQAMLNATHAMFEQTLSNVKQTYYTKIPGIFLKTVGRWLISDPTYQAGFLRYLSRAIDPADYRAVPRHFPKIILEGVTADIRNRLRSR